MNKTVIDELPIEEVLKRFVISMKGEPIEKILSKPYPDNYIGGYGQEYVFNVSNQKLADRFTSFDEMEDICGSSFANAEYVGNSSMNFNYTSAERCDFSGSKLKIFSESSSFGDSTFENAIISGSTFSGDFFGGTNFKNCQARDCTFDRCEFENAIVDGADFTDSKFIVYSKQKFLKTLKLSPEMIANIEIESDIND